MPTQLRFFQTDSSEAFSVATGEIWGEHWAAECLKAQLVSALTLQCNFPTVYKQELC